jgi:hypothetical protein
MVCACVVGERYSNYYGLEDKVQILSDGSLNDAEEDIGLPFVCQSKFLCLPGHSCDEISQVGSVGRVQGLAGAALG